MPYNRLFYFLNLSAAGIKAQFRQQKIKNHILRLQKLVLTVHTKIFRLKAREHKTKD